MVLPVSTGKLFIIVLFATLDIRDLYLNPIVSKPLHDLFLSLSFTEPALETTSSNALVFDVVNVSC